MAVVVLVGMILMALFCTCYGVFVDNAAMKKKNLEMKEKKN
jgi:hypothetical protein